ncbi:MBL fold metallo-hydrolase [Actinophytocola oryzae]|uniref:Glyoxylase-like metal-dependent hydrolase (Beta-lactamase superfamily II) n=1 Tax=Actinophytocola oryzae TaxID=502181 RepID=A0A4R7V5Y7_9PSEU|nr:MBL fold metallo-hydrolase [Actinophytocola oryzae]TDV44234.1 glyoxylase-like metal-dependent hydrolase (beta-lactamase superfamily II) [Actinophytocola oryzae]
MNNLTVETYTAGEAGILVNSHIVTTGDGVVLIDAGLLVSDARALADRITATGLPVLAAFVTHPHPDHFNGLPYVVSEDVPVYSTAAVAQVVKESADDKRAQWQPTYGDEWPDRHRVPDPAPAEGVAFGDLRVSLHDVGPAESHADSYLIVESGGERLAFVGDLAFDGVHSYTADGHSARWLTTLDRLVTDLAGLPLYPGHGAPGDVGLLARQQKYLRAYRDRVRELAAGADRLTDAQKQELTATMTHLLPDAPLAWLVAHGADAVAEELAA